MGPAWVLSAPDGPHVGPMNLAIRDLVICCVCAYQLILLEGITQRQLGAFLLTFIIPRVRPWINNYMRRKCISKCHLSHGGYFAVAPTRYFNICNCHDRYTRWSLYISWWLEMNHFCSWHALYSLGMPQRWIITFSRLETALDQWFLLTFHGDK